MGVVHVEVAAEPGGAGADGRGAEGGDGGTVGGAGEVDAGLVDGL